MKWSIRNLGSRGDTMVEVMIAIAIVGSVLTAAFAVTNRNIDAAQDVQEQSIGVRLVQEQIELLSTHAFNPGTATCFLRDGSGDTQSDGSGYCHFTDASSGADYEVRIIEPSPNKFQVEAKWEGLNSNKNVTMYYYRVLT